MRHGSARDLLGLRRHIVRPEWNLPENLASRKAGVTKTWRHEGEAAITSQIGFEEHRENRVQPMEPLHYEEIEQRCRAINVWIGMTVIFPFCREL